eukprot:CAMPEP_0201945412 /NCGR_PEP_ID=MMETSP0903-20130614/53888_1 /ASSEMBLY_ACC=CAM_ASM_000552 /TAXON_ID=420261 /ORGANISM="Thalassiosira antarctica, Strain CCMP982" /LENGTH=422 /DNA_ID=CAMNT_0048488479 /DNA_START=75 /DNA_END=1344 /DNA_ORIENTATION=+
MDQQTDITENIDIANTPLAAAAAVAKRKAEDNLAAGYDVAAAAAAAPPVLKRHKSSEDEEAKRQARLESNRKAARESRRRKKVLVEELQRSVIFFTRANAQLKQKNEGLETMLFAARGQMEGQQQPGGVAPPAAMTGGLQESAAAAEDRKPSAQIQAPVTAPTSLPPAANQPAPANQHTMPNPAAQAMVQNNNNLMANWLAMAQAVPNPMAMQLQVEELQRSVIFFTRANAQLKQKNEGLEAMLFAARGQMEGQQQPGGVAPPAAMTGGLQESATTAEDRKPSAQIHAPVAAPQPAANQHMPNPAAQAMVQNNNNNLMANWLAMAQAVPNPMAMQLPSAMAMGMFNPAMANPGLMGMAAAAGMGGMGNPFLGQLQASTAMANNAMGGNEANHSSAASPASSGGGGGGSAPVPSGPPEINVIC